MVAKIGLSYEVHSQKIYLRKDLWQLILYFFGLLQDLLSCSDNFSSDELETVLSFDFSTLLKKARHLDDLLPENVDDFLSVFGLIFERYFRSLDMENVSALVSTSMTTRKSCSLKVPKMVTETVQYLTTFYPSSGHFGAVYYMFLMYSYRFRALVPEIPSIEALMRQFLESKISTYELCELMSKLCHNEELMHEIFFASMAGELKFLHTWLRCCLSIEGFSSDVVTISYQLRMLQSLQLYLSDRFTITSDSTSKDILLSFFSTVGSLRFNDLTEKCHFTAIFLTWVTAPVEAAISDLSKPQSNPRLRHILESLSMLVEHCALLIHQKNDPNSLLKKIIDKTALSPQWTKESNEPVDHSAYQTAVISTVRGLLKFTDPNDRFVINTLCEIFRLQMWSFLLTAHIHLSIRISTEFSCCSCLFRVAKHSASYKSTGFTIVLYTSTFSLMSLLVAHYSAHFLVSPFVIAVVARTGSIVHFSQPSGFAATLRLWGTPQNSYLALALVFTACCMLDANPSFSTELGTGYSSLCCVLTWWSTSVVFRLSHKKLTGWSKSRMLNQIVYRNQPFLLVIFARKRMVIPHTSKPKLFYADTFTGSACSYLVRVRYQIVRNSICLLIRHYGSQQTADPVLRHSVLFLRDLTERTKSIEILSEEANLVLPLLFISWINSKVGSTAEITELIHLYCSRIILSEQWQPILEQSIRPLLADYVHSRRSNVRRLLEMLTASHRTLQSTIGQLLRERLLQLGNAKDDLSFAVNFNLLWFGSLSDTVAGQSVDRPSAVDRPMTDSADPDERGDFRPAGRLLG
ncbi:unnamed protein product [Soboliphyme baturini]|uniref:Protein MMS22-like n=1 Tax=Soboliphyme baturini TaxID=241478 RepID=A0A183IE83_9BILA|nr:unnamed protein product [Soboliphyme baturini]